MLVTFMLLMLEAPGRPGNVIAREALDVLGVGGKVDAGTDTGEGMGDKRMARKEKMDKPPTSMLAMKRRRC